MRVRFSHDAFRLQRHGGVSRYFAELHQGLLVRGVDSRVLAGLHQNEHVKGVAAVAGLDICGVRPRALRQALSKVTDRALERVWAIRSSPETIYHKTYFDHWVPKSPTLAVTVFDMIHELFPTNVSKRDLTVAAKRRWCDAADVIFAISQQTKDDVVEVFGIEPERIVVTHLGVRRTLPLEPSPAVGSPPFLLYVGERGWAHKCFRPFLSSFARADDAKGCHLVCFGGGPVQTDERELIESLGIADRVKVVGGDDRVLAAYYTAATALIYPSLYEGFGLPTLEAMVHGCPVAAGTGGAVSEVTGDAALLFDPADADAITDAINTIVTDEARRADLVARGRVRAAGFTWDATIAATLGGYQRVMLRP